jgi:hypothetical protein
VAGVVEVMAVVVLALDGLDLVVGLPGGGEAALAALLGMRARGNLAVGVILRLSILSKNKLRAAATISMLVCLEAVQCVYSFCLINRQLW